MSDLLKQAIADAKAVRATALSNAKAALEEHFAPKLQSMLSEKLREELDAEEPVAPEAPVADAPEAVPAPEAPVDVAPAPEAVPAPEAAPIEAPVADEPAAPVAEDEAGIEEFESEIEEDTANEPGTSNAGNPHPGFNLAEGEKASSNYKSKTSGHKTEDKGQEIKDSTKMSTPSEGKSADGSRKASDNYTGKNSMKKGSPVKDMHNKAPKTDDPQGASNEFSKGAKKAEDQTAALKENAEEVDEVSLDEILKELEHDLNDTGVEEMAAPTDVQSDESSNDEEIDLNELLSEDTDEEHDEKKEDDKDDEKDEVVKENISLKKELEEYRSAVVYLRDRINEVSLLNAKLLYTNKLFKGANLSNDQKLKVIESFDLTKSVREAKLVYATLAESLNSGGKKTAVEPVKKTVSQTVKTITEGLASKPVASTKPTKPAVLTEGAEMANRFKKLAGIRK